MERMGNLVGWHFQLGLSLKIQLFNSTSIYSSDHLTTVGLVTFLSGCLQILGDKGQMDNIHTVN